MHSQHRNFFSIGISFLFVLAMTLAGRGLAEAAVINVTPANVKAAADRANANKAEGAADIDDIQDILAADATYVGDEDILNFAPGEYKDAGELLITRAITLRKDPDADGKVMFTGKVLINVKADDVVVEGLEFMDVTVPDAVTMTVDRDRNTAGNQPLIYGFPGKTIKEMLDEDGFDVDDQELAGPYLNPKLGGTGSYYNWVALPFVTVVDPDSTTNNGRVADRLTGAPIAGARTPGTENASPEYAIQDSILAGRAKGVLGVIWVDSSAVAVGASCKMSTADPPAVLPQIKGVVITNNVFNGTETAGVRAGSMRSLLVRGGALRSCRVQLDIIGNTFSNIGGTGGFVKVRDEGTNLPDVTDADGNKIAEPGNVAPAISVTSPAGTSDAKTRILSNTITGGLGDGIELRWTPLGQKVDIKNNLLIDTPLDGITVIGSGFAATDTTTDISITGNKIIGTSDNRYLTIHQAISYDSADPILYGRHFPESPAASSIFSTGTPSVWSLAVPGAGGCVGATAVRLGVASPAWNSDAQKELRRAMVERVELELWRSGIPETATGAVNFDRGVKFLPAYADSSELASLFLSGSRFSGTGASSLVSRSALFRIAADRCFDLARIKVYDQAGVSITGNDLGYDPPDTPEKRFDVIDYGIVIAGADAMKLKALSGNNIDFASVSSIKNGGASLSVAGNYFGPREPQFGGTVTGRDDVLDSPSETMAGPRDADINPDTAAPGLTTSGDDAPMVDGTTLTLTFDENLDGESVPAESAFTVMADVPSRAGARREYSVDDVGVAGMKVTLTLGETVDPGTTGLTVTYTKPASNALADASGNEIAGFSSRVNVASTPPVDPAGPAAMPGSDDGGCALASAGSAGTGMSIMLLPLMLAGLAFVLRRRAATG